MHQLRVRPVWPLTASVSSPVPQEGSPRPLVSAGRRERREALPAHAKVLLSLKKQSLWLVLGSRDKVQRWRTFRHCAERQSLQEPQTRPRPRIRAAESESRCRQRRAGSGPGRGCC